MANDDNLVFDAIAHVRIIDISCPRQLLALMRWIMEGNRGLLYVRLMRTGSAVIYGPEYEFEFGKGHVVRRGEDDRAVIVSSGRGVHEALAASKQVSAGVVDMPSIDEDLLLRLYDSQKLLCFAEQNNGYIFQNFLKILYRRGISCNWDRVMTVNTLDANGRPQFIHSGTYEELLEAFGLSPSQLAGAIAANVLVVGAAVGAYGERMVRAMLPHGPFEVAAYSLELTLYLEGRRRPLPAARLTGTIAASVALLALAALLETYR
jgi:transketolase C-terminal domain/subunit